MDFEKFMEQHKVNFEIMRLRQEGKTYNEIADQLNFSKERIGQRYRKFFCILNRFYIQYLKSAQVQVDERRLMDFYESSVLVTAYMEKTYKEYLDLFRHGTPPLIPKSHNDFPSFRELTDEEILELEKKILKAREHEKRTFTDIGKKLELSREKAHRIYELYYHKKVLKALKKIKPTVDLSIEDYVYDYSNDSHKRWELIVREYSELVQDLID